MFKKVLIANRGAIAVRIERTLRRMGIASAAVYTSADQDSLHVDGADEAVLIGAGPAKESYLDAERILQLAVEIGAEAVHPGYGFLSENAGFARACRERGIAFIGPTPEQMEVFGLKHSAREVAGKACVPLLPGTELITELSDAVEQAGAIGYPVILKSTAGGGGIGMRICEDEQTLIGAFESVTHLAETNFNNGGVFLEKYIARARHVEVQIFGNGFGEVVALGERDCSIQRRNQKVIEESPAPNLPQDVREAMHSAARSLAAEVGYRSAGTVEFLYDPETCGFYFLEVNTRLQVEHGVTEEVLGIDLVEWMVREAADELTDLKSLFAKPQGHSIQARIYAEDCLHDFRPSAGRIDRGVFPEEARVETWIRDGITVTTLYDPMLAKIIVHGKDRMEAIDKLADALAGTRIYGITSNIQYLQALLGERSVREGHVFTRLLGGFSPLEHALEVLDGGIQSTIQDFPGRVGHWDVGVPPCGPMDPLSFRIGNILLGNREDAPGIEMTLRGGSYRFRSGMKFCLTGADMGAELEGSPVPMYRVISANRGDMLTFGEAKEGMRGYLLVESGFDVPAVLGSASTFTLGEFGGHGGRALRPGDVIRVREAAAPGEKPAFVTESGFPQDDSARFSVSEPFAVTAEDGQQTDSGSELQASSRPRMTKEWTIGVIPGPHSTVEFLKPEYLKQLEGTRWEVHFNSSRTGIRLIGPAPLWSREDGGEAGLHPSNIHDNAYAIGALDLTGDMPILLGPDGPSLGGFVCPVTTATAEFWKIGQLRPGDSVRFRLITLEEARELLQQQERSLTELGEGKRSGLFAEALPEAKLLPPSYPVLAEGEEGERFRITVRCSGDRNLLVEYGEMELDLVLRFRVHALMEAIVSSGAIPVRDLTPGIRSLQIHLDPALMTVEEACRKVLEIDWELPSPESIQVPSRIVRLPLSWDDPATQLAIQRYQQGVRPDAPWCPSNLEFIRRVNGLDSLADVKRIVFDASYLVLGLGDVYLGAPVATPLDPRHRLVTTKYNPARTWTPENAVGIGGAYMCVYGMEGPGGYQFVGRTIQMWNRLRSTESFKPGKPWLLRFFDQIQFFPVEADDLLQLREDFLRGRYEADITETTFNLGDYLVFLEQNRQTIEDFRRVQRDAFREERESWKRLGLAEYVSDPDPVRGADDYELPEGAVAVRCSMPGSVWKVLVEPGQRVKKGDTLIIQESMKMEFNQLAPCDGTVGTIHVKPGDEVHAGKLLADIIKEEREAVIG
ncbi:urea carboxylase [Paenibacillus beijingensis]|uniref:Urea carboxylase n=1 Tax=Paenibacillus beijingensis TaxID=1126833 RepID=A0A0D5NPN9_9BACL|nr:urea carboxylase [Paenibacillus beijingensis]AJY76982.1 urea carboxylase [Paenibacillus beijingensis]